MLHFTLSLYLMDLSQESTAREQIKQPSRNTSLSTLVNCQVFTLPPLPLLVGHSKIDMHYLFNDPSFVQDR